MGFIKTHHNIQEIPSVCFHWSGGFCHNQNHDGCIDEDGKYRIEESCLSKRLGFFGVHQGLI
jgi:hypothetical protein